MKCSKSSPRAMASSCRRQSLRGARHERHSKLERQAVFMVRPAHTGRASFWPWRVVGVYQHCRGHCGQRRDRGRLHPPDCAARRGRRGAEILVTDGDTVAAGEVLLRLDGTLLRSELAIVEGQLFELLARLDRLRAERDEADSITFGPDLLTQAHASPAVQKVVDGQADLFVARLISVREETARLAERKTQLSQQIIGIEAQVVATTRQHRIVASELEGQETLLGNGLTQLSQVSALQREEASLSG
ncbi:MAG TPA: biotin/lipoyl-binding protein, partial [Rhodobacteraceae bacterium]|nr:biotin/lipoyl-binding protein [Paracoccaceae bacterium]